MTTVIDISALGNLEPTQPLDLSKVPQAPKPAAFPKSGRYTVRVPEAITAENFGKTQAGNLKATISATLVGGESDGYEIRYNDLSAKVYTDPRTQQETSQLGQYLQAFGITEELTGDPQQAANLVAATAGKTAEVWIDWIAEHRPTQFKLRGMKNFPSDGNGGFQSYVVHPDENVKDAEGNPLRLRARLEIRRWLPLNQ